MDASFPPLVSANELQGMIEDQNLVLIDARSGPGANLAFNKEHLTRAVFADLETDLADVKADAANGGRHPLPEIEDFSTFLGNCGIGQKSHVVIYDAMSGANAAARCWWMLKAVGHSRVQVLDGGWQAALKAGIPTQSGSVEPIIGSSYPVSGWQLPIRSIREVNKNIASHEFDLLDVRSSERFNGIVEPIDPMAGHIPGAMNIPLSENLNEDGTFKSPEQLDETYGGFDPNKLAIHCGSGVTACHTLLAFSHMKKEIPALYVGSWSEWCRNDMEMILK